MTENTAPEDLPRTWLPAALIVLAGTLAHLNGFSGVFVFDDGRHILDNAAVRSLWPLTQSLSAAPNAARPLPGLTFALNYAVSGYSIWSYHLFNLLSHLCAGLALFGAVRRVLLSPRLAPAWAGRATAAACAAALFWTLHPLHIQAVTYITQRFQSLMGLFFLLTVYCSLRAAGGGAWPYRTAAVLCCWAGMACKQDMLTAPLLVLFLDAFFFSAGWADALRRRAGLYLGLAAGWLLLWYLQGLAPKAYFAGFAGMPVTPLQYGLTQLQVITRYLSLTFLAGEFCFDYRWQTVYALKEALPEAFLVGGLLAATLLGLARRAPAAAAGAWFFGTLAVTSSVFPIADFACEYRMYLPSAGLAALLACGLVRLAEFCPRPKAALYLAAAAVALALGTRTALENRLYADEDRLWAETARRRPANPRAWNNVGVGYELKGDLQKAVECYARAFELDPYYGAALDSLARAALRLGRPGEAVALLRRATAGYPVYRYPLAHYRLAELLAQAGQAAEAELNYRRALEMDPNLSAAYLGLGALYRAAGRSAEAKMNFEKAAALKR